MTDVDDDLELVQAEHHVPDGTRPLIIDKPLLGLEATTAPRHYLCHMAQHNAAHNLPSPSGCRETILGGEHVLRHVERDIGGVLLATHVTWWCAPCAIREWGFWGVREVAS